MPRKTGEDQLLLLTLHMLRQRKIRIPLQCLGGQIRTACSRARARTAAPPRGSWLCIADQRAEVGRHRDVHFRSRWLSVSPQMCRRCSDGSAPRRDSTWSLQPVTRQYGKHPQAVTYHTKGVWCGCDTEPTTKIMLPSAASPSKRKSTVSMRGSQATKYFFAAGNKSYQKKKKRQNDETERRWAKVLHVFIWKGHKHTF